MTTSPDSGLPFVLTYAERIERENDASRGRHDCAQQLAQVWTADGWIHAVQCVGPLGETRITKVAKETTDDD